MTQDNNCSNAAHHKLSLVGVLVTLGIVFGDIGTSPLYVMKAIVRAGNPVKCRVYHWCCIVYYMDFNPSKRPLSMS